MGEPLIRASGLSKVYGQGSTAVMALAAASLEIRAGDRVAILGKSGSGKSTMLNLLGGLDRPTAGQLVVDGRDLATFSRPRMAHYRLTTIGFIFQSFHLVASKSIGENCELPLILNGMPPAERRQRAFESLDAVGLRNRIHHRPADLSGGERQRAAIARALINRPKILLADEPTGNLDSANALAITELILAQVRDRGMTLILVTHDEDLAGRMTDRVLRMADGKIVRDGPPDQTLRS
jgi:putative ABC transport system ATP-binding protein